MTDPVVALPIRSFQDAYRRLADAVDPDRRAVLARAMASRTAGSVHRAGPVPVIVSSAPEVSDWASARGYVVIADPPGGGLNGAAHQVVRYAGSRPWLILHSDLPCLTAAEVSTAAEALRPDGSVIAPSYDGGTSALGGHGPLPFSYGVASFHSHLHTAPRPVVLSSLGFQLDIDSPHDLDVAARHPRGAWLVEQGLVPERGHGDR